MSMMWAYGVQTCVQRLETYLPTTLRSLRGAGFPQPRLFIDGIQREEDYRGRGYEITARYPASHTYPNWLLGIMELWLRHPFADRFAMFQDDLIAAKNLRQYLEVCQYPEEPAYLNLYTAYGNEDIVAGKRTGWHLSNQNGRGALALVFARESLARLLTSDHMIRRPSNRKDVGYGPGKMADGSMAYWKNLDGGCIEAFKLMQPKQGKEWIHQPSLVQHIGLQSSIGNGRYRETTHGDHLAKTWRGEQWDAMSLVGG